MTRAADTILDAALALTDKERAEIAHRLLVSLDGPEPGGEEQARIDADWAKEIRRRARRVERGEVELFPADQVLAEAMAVVKKVRSGRKGKKR